MVPVFSRISIFVLYHNIYYIISNDEREIYSVILIKDGVGYFSISHLIYKDLLSVIQAIIAVFTIFDLETEQQNGR